MIYLNRNQAGQILGQMIQEKSKTRFDAVFALPRGGIPVAFEIAKLLQLPLVPYFVRKLGVPEQEELAMGAIAADGSSVLNQSMIRNLKISSSSIEVTRQREMRKIHDYQKLFNKAYPTVPIEEKSILIADDGLATGSTMQVALKSLRKYHPQVLAIAIPVGPSSLYDDFKEIADEVFCSHTPKTFFGVGDFYEDFAPVPDEECIRLLKAAQGSLKKS